MANTSTNSDADPRAAVAESSGHAAFLHPDGSVSVFRKSWGGTLVPLGAGRWRDGIIRGSGVNCGVLVRLERDLRRKTGAPYSASPSALLGA